MKINRGNLAWLCFAWCALLLLGIAPGLNIPFVLALVGTVLMVIA